MYFVRRPAWFYYPQPDRPRLELRELIDAMEAIGEWLEEDWWQREKKDTKEITRALEAPPPSPGSRATTRYPVLARGWNLETREHYPNMPFLYAEGDESIQSVEPDAVFVDGDDRLTLVEI